jgi:hypothetical protein
VGCSFGEQFAAATPLSLPTDGASALNSEITARSLQMIPEPTMRAG